MMSRKPRVVIYAGALSGAGGAERIVWEEERYLRSKGIDVAVVASSLTPDSLMGYQPARVEIVPQSRSLPGRLLALRRTLVALKPDLVIAQSTRCAMGLFLVTAGTGIPYVTHIHGTLFWFVDDSLKYSFIHRRVFQDIHDSVRGHAEFVPGCTKFTPVRRLRVEVEALLDYLAVRKSRAIITLTEQLQWEIRRLYDKDAVVARGCLAPESLDYTPRQDIRARLGLGGSEVLLSVGRLDPRKRVDVIISAFARVALAHPRAVLLIGGKGGEEERLRALAGQLGLADRVRFLGFIPEDELLDYYAACDVFVFPSWTTSGITTYEALATGAKVVWTSEADEPVLRDPHVFVADPTPEAFADAICRALDTKLTTPIDLSAYTWDRYFDTVYAEGVRPFLPHSRR